MYSASDTHDAKTQKKREQFEDHEAKLYSIQLNSTTLVKSRFHKIQHMIKWMCCEVINDYGLAFCLNAESITRVETHLASFPGYSL